jgi:opacity protein-like surface antigen
MGFACTPGGVGCANVNFAGTASSVNTGWAAGGGVAYSVDPRITIGVEYLRIDLGRSSVTAFDQNGNFPGTTLTESQRFAEDLVRFSVNFRF